MRAVVFIAALLLAPSAAAGTAPEGFRESPVLSKKATLIAGGPGVVYCSASEMRWLQYAVETLGHAQAHAFTNRTTGEVYMPRGTCVAMERWLRGKRVVLGTLGFSIQTLHHESLHVRGIVSERVAECRSWRYLPNIARKHFGIRSAKTMRRVLAGAERYFC